MNRTRYARISRKVRFYVLKVRFSKWKKIHYTTPAAMSVHFVAIYN